MKLIYQPDKKNQKTDTLSQKKQDTLSDNNTKIFKKELQLLKPNYLKIKKKQKKKKELKRIRKLTIKPRKNIIRIVINKKKKTNKEYIMAKKALKKEIRHFLLILKLKLLLIECSINKNNKIKFRDKK